MLSALGAPVSALSLDMRSGKLGGICSVDGGASAAAPRAQGEAPATTGTPDTSEAPAHGHCPWCASPGLALLPLGWPRWSAAPTPARGAVTAPTERVAQVLGLPFSRGPPTL